jgi:hypothetical protein
MGGFLVLVLIVVGPHVLMDQYHKGNIPAAQEECRAEVVRSPSGTAYRRYVDLNGDCVYSEAIR